METNGEIDRRGQIDRWRDGGRKMRDERGKTSAFSARPAPLPDLFFPPQRNKSRNRLKAPIPDLVAFHPRRLALGLGPGPCSGLAVEKKSQEEKKKKNSRQEMKRTEVSFGVFSVRFAQLEKSDLCAQRRSFVRRGRLSGEINK